MNGEHETNPDNLIPTQEDLISMLVGSLQRIEAQLATWNLDEPPRWAKNLFDGLLNVTARIEKLEDKVEHRENVCKYNHPKNGGALKQW